MSDFPYLTDQEKIDFCNRVKPTTETINTLLGMVEGLARLNGDKLKAGDPQEWTNFDIRVANARYLLKGK